MLMAKQNMMWRVGGVLLICACSATVGALRAKAQSCVNIPGVGAIRACALEEPCDDYNDCIVFECSGNQSCNVGANGGEACQDLGCWPYNTSCGSCV